MGWKREVEKQMRDGYCDLWRGVHDLVVRIGKLEKHLGLHYVDSPDGENGYPKHILKDKNNASKNKRNSTDGKD